MCNNISLLTTVYVTLSPTEPYAIVLETMEKNVLEQGRFSPILCNYMYVCRKKQTKQDFFGI